MTAVNLKGFRPHVPRLSDRLKEPNQAVVALNCKLKSGRLDPLRRPFISFVSAGQFVKTLYRFRSYNDTVTREEWMTWPEVVDAVPSPLANDEEGRIYFTSDSFEPRMTTFDQALTGMPYPGGWWVLGVVSPRVKPTVVHSAGSGASVERDYAYTFVTALGEESGPSPAAGVTTGTVDGTWTISNMQTAPPNSGAITAASANTPTTNRVRLTVDSTFGLAAGERLEITGVVGLTDINGLQKIALVDHDLSYVYIDVQTSQTYTSGGTWTRTSQHNTLAMRKRLYRTAGDEANFMLVAEISVATTSYVDAVADEDLGEMLETLNTLPPPKNLRCLVSMPNGCLAGLSGNELCISDPNMPYSWPVANRYSFSGRGVSLAAVANSLLVLTEDFPIMFSGSDPDAMVPTVMETYAPCVSARGAKNIGGGVVYPSYDGLYLAAPGRVENLTEKLYSLDEWKLLAPATFDAEVFDNCYYASFTAPNATGSRTWVLNLRERDGAIEVDDFFDCLYRNNYDGELYVVRGREVFRWDAHPSSFYTTDWKSAEIQLPSPTNFAICQIHADFVEEVPIDLEQLALNEAILDDPIQVGGFLGGDNILGVNVNGSRIVPLGSQASQRVEFVLYKDRQPIFTKQVLSSRPYRLPSGYRSEVFQIGLSTTVPVYTVTIAQSTAELAQVSM
jgi:hypothetical protein